MLIGRTNAAGPLSNRIDQYLRTSQVNGITFEGEEVSRKRPATEDLSSPVKKLKSDQQVPQITIDPAISLAFLVDPTNPMALYDIQSIPLPTVTEIVIRTLAILPPQLLEDRLNVPPPQRAHLTPLVCPSPTFNVTCTIHQRYPKR